MLDISMCEGYSCPIKIVCQRFTAEPSNIQSYFKEDPRMQYPDYSSCLFFIPVQLEVPRPKLEIVRLLANANMLTTLVIKELDRYWKIDVKKLCRDNGITYFIEK